MIFGSVWIIKIELRCDRIRSAGALCARRARRCEPPRTLSMEISASLNGTPPHHHYHELPRKGRLSTQVFSRNKMLTCTECKASTLARSLRESKSMQGAQSGLTKVEDPQNHNAERNTIKDALYTQLSWTTITSISLSKTTTRNV
jgi:hypothetical protein